MFPAIVAFATDDGPLENQCEKVEIPSEELTEDILPGAGRASSGAERALTPVCFCDKNTVKRQHLPVFLS